MGRFSALHALGTSRREAWARWTSLKDESDPDTSAIRAAWLAVVKADDEYHREFVRLMSAGVDKDDLARAAQEIRAHETPDGQD